LMRTRKVPIESPLNKDLARDTFMPA
jgi:hypothetical protein